jgi:hypothetical protein
MLPPPGAMPLLKSDGILPRIAIIGAGPSGLCVARSFDRHGIAYDQFEADTALGGIWNHGAYTTAHIISSRKITQFPEFPMPAGYADFPSQQQLLDYLNAYADRFALRARIAFNTKVVLVKPLDQGGWELTFEQGGQRRYHGVVVCNGHHWDRRWPSYPGEFSGEIIHSKDYRNPEQLRGRRVLVIGGGNSACDIVSEAARVAAEAHLSLRHGYWFMPKTAFGVPIVELIGPYPLWLQRLMYRLVLAICVGDYRRYGLPLPNHRIFDRHPTISTEALHYLKHGRIHPRPDVRRYNGDHVEFADGTGCRFDLIICATGYHVSYPFLAPGLADVTGSVVRNYWGMISPQYRHLYLVGWGQPRSGFGTLLEPLAETLAQAIKTQERMRYPLGAVLRRMHMPLPETHLADPFQLERGYRNARRLLRLLPKLEDWLCKDADRAAPKIPAPPTQSAQPMRVY